MIPDTFLIHEKNNGEQLVVPTYGVGNHSWKDWNLRWLPGSRSYSLATMFLFSV